jgi:hypothetical protein
MTMEIRPVFEVRVGDLAGEHRHYKIYADGSVEGFADGDKPVMVLNRVPIAEAMARNEMYCELKGLPFTPEVSFRRTAT